MQEIFSLIREELERANCYHMITQGVVLTGGTALLPGITDLAAKVFKTNARIGKPAYEGELADLINEPRFSTVMGLLDFAVEQEMMAGPKRSNRKKGFVFFNKIVNWMRDFF